MGSSFTIPLTVRPGSEDAQLAARKTASHKIAGRALVNILAVLFFSLISLFPPFKKISDSDFFLRQKNLERDELNKSDRS